MTTAVYTASETPQSTLADYFAVLRRRKWIILLAVVLTTASAVFFSSHQERLYQASAEVFVNPNSQLITGAGFSAADVQARFLNTEAQLAQTPTVASIVVRKTSIPGVTAESLLAQSTVSADSTSNILTFRVTNRDPASAKTLANSYADAFVADVQREEAANIDKAAKDLNHQIAKIGVAIDAAQQGGGDVPGALQTQLNAYNRQAQELQQLKIGLPTSARVSGYAQDATQTQPNLRKNALIGIFLGLALGVGLAFGRDALDSRVRSSEEVAARLGMPLLARFPTPPRALRTKHRLAMMSDVLGTHSEAYRKLGVAFDFANLKPRARSVLVTSALEQEGKTTTAANLAIALARAGRRVIFVELDLRRPNVHRYFDIKGRPGVTDVALGHVSLEDALVAIPVAGHPVSSTSNGHIVADEDATAILLVLPAGSIPPDPAEFLASASLRAVMAEIAERADVVLIDSPPLLPVSDPMIVSNYVDAVLVVVRAELIRRPVLGELRRMLGQSQAPTLGFAFAGSEAETGYGYEDGYGDGGYRAVGQSQEGATETMGHTAGNG